MKKALLIGINYIGTNDALNGCINDIKNINDILTKRCGYNSQDIRILTDETQVKPNRNEIENGIRWLVNNCKAGDTLFFYYSGHGSQITDRSGDESDGKDDVLVPLDYTKSGVISDDWMFLNLSSVLPSGVTLWSFTDCCHSGTMMDLQYNLQCNSVFRRGKTNKNIVYNTNEWTNQFGFSTEKNRVTNADVYSFSGCLDPQTAADAFIKNQSQGAFTACLLEFFDARSTKLPDGNLRFNSGSIKLIDMLKEVNCRLIIKGFNQRSQLSMGKVNDVNRTFSP